MPRLKFAAYRSLVDLAEDSVDITKNMLVLNDTDDETCVSMVSNGNPLQVHFSFEHYSGEPPLKINFVTKNYEDEKSEMVWASVSEQGQSYIWQCVHTKDTKAEVNGDFTSWQAVCEDCKVCKEIDFVIFKLFPKMWMKPFIAELCEIRKNSIIIRLN